MNQIKRKVNNKMKWYGETNFGPKVTKIVINKKLHKKAIKKDKSILKKSRTLIDTIVHEEMHARHPKMHEKTVRKMTPRKVAKMSRLSKNKLYKKYAR